MESVNRAILNLDWITGVILASLFFLAIAKRFFYSRFLSFMILPFNNKYIFLYNKKDRLFNGFQLFFSLFQIFNFALFASLGAALLMDEPSYRTPIAFLVVLLAILIFMIVKALLQIGNGYVFNNSRVISEFIFKKVSYFNYSGLVMVMANVVLCYIDPGSKAVVYGAVFLILLINTVGWITLIKNHQKLIASYFFYFILYLCALEIAPLVLIVNALTF